MPFLGEIPVSNMDISKDTYKTRVEDIRVNKEVPLVTPQFLKMSILTSPKAIDVVKQSRKQVEQVIKQNSDKLLVVVGPCSVHDPDAAAEYCERLKSLADELSDDIIVIMRAYLEKPRTTVGWKGLINDPELDGSFQTNKGLAISRQLFCTLTNMGMPIASEMLDCVSPKYLADCISLGAIGARTTESQLHRELASGLSFPVGFKNGTDGGVEVAADSLLSAGSAHNFMGITDQGLTSIVQTEGNKHSFVILPGGTKGTKMPLMCKRPRMCCVNGASRKL